MYTKEGLSHDISRILGIGAQSWIWERQDVRGRLNQVLAAASPGLEGRQVIAEMLEYCWCAYSKAYIASGDQLIGRSEDLTSAKRKVANIDLARGQTLFDHGTRGNILEMDKWVPIVNDAWVMGGVHRHADFHLVSPRAVVNLWYSGADGQRLVVTAREILGLIRFGYRRTVSGDGKVKYVCGDPYLAMASSLPQYAQEIREKEVLGMAATTELVGIRDDLANQILRFQDPAYRPQHQVARYAKPADKSPARRWPVTGAN